MYIISFKIVFLNLQQFKSIELALPYDGNICKTKWIYMIMHWKSFRSVLFKLALTPLRAIHTKSEACFVVVNNGCGCKMIQSMKKTWSTSHLLCHLQHASGALQ